MSTWIKNNYTQNYVTYNDITTARILHMFLLRYKLLKVPLRQQNKINIYKMQYYTLKSKSYPERLVHVVVFGFVF